MAHTLRMLLSGTILSSLASTNSPPHSSRFICTIRSGTGGITSENMRRIPVMIAGTLSSVKQTTRLYTLYCTRALFSARWFTGYNVSLFVNYHVWRSIREMSTPPTWGKFSESIPQLSPCAELICALYSNGTTDSQLLHNAQHTVTI